MNHKEDQLNSISRRDFIRTATAATLFAAVPFLAKSESLQSKRILIAYYSHTGNTRAMAQQIQQITGGDIFEIVPEVAYEGDNATIRERATKEMVEGAYTKLKAKAENIGSYDIIFIGSPIWMGTHAAPAVSFIKNHNLAGKTVVPFTTFNTRETSYFVDMQALCTSSTVLEGLGLKGPEVGDSMEKTKEWVGKLNLK